MKKHFIALAALVFGFQLAHAQTEKGKQTLGLSVNYSYNENSNVNFGQNTAQRNRNDNFNIGPVYGYFISNNLELGISPTYGRSKQSYSNNSQQNTYSQHGFGITALLNKYFLYQNKFGFRTGGYLSYGHDVINNSYRSFNPYFSDTQIAGSSNGYRAGAGLALVYFPLPKMGITATIAGVVYSHNNTGTSDGSVSKTDVVQASFINNLALSAFYVFGGK